MNTPFPSPAQDEPAFGSNSQGPSPEAAQGSSEPVMLANGNLPSAAGGNGTKTAPTKAEPRAGKITFAPGGLLRPLGPGGPMASHAFFKVLRVTPNGWVHCIVMAYANGERCWSPEGSRPLAKFRTTDCEPIAALPPEPARKSA